MIIKTILLLTTGPTTELDRCWARQGEKKKRKAKEVSAVHVLGDEKRWRKRERAEKLELENMREGPGETG